jgi:hypothetical protein
MGMGKNATRCCKMGHRVRILLGELKENAILKFNSNNLIGKWSQRSQRDRDTAQDSGSKETFS